MCGGVTTVCDMPNTHPPVTTADRFRAKRELVEGTSYCDFALWAGGTDLDELAAMAGLGAVGVKVYMNRSHRPDDPYAAELSLPDGDPCLPSCGRARASGCRSPCTSRTTSGRRRRGRS